MGQATCVKTAETSGQKKPAVHAFDVDVALPSARHEPSAHAVHAAAAPVECVPTGHTVPVVVMVVADTADAYATLSVYVPAPPVPVPSATMCVPAVTPAKVNTCPTASVPMGAPVTVSVVDAALMAPEKLTAPVPAAQKAPAGHGVPVAAPCAQYCPAAHGFDVAERLPVAVQKPGAHWCGAPVGAAERPAGQKKPRGHALVEPVAWPATHQKPAGQGTCVVSAVVAEGQKKPAEHAFDVAVVLPSARQFPAAHAAHAAYVVAVVPPADHVPTGHAVVTRSPVPAGQ